MKKFLCLIISAMVFVSAFTVNTFALQDDVKAAYMNELQWLYKTTDLDSYCVYDINKDGYKELIVRTGADIADYSYKLYTCSYGEIVYLGEYDGYHTALYECDENGIFIYRAYAGSECLFKVSKEGNTLKSATVFAAEAFPDYHPPKKPIDLTYCKGNLTYYGLY